MAATKFPDTQGLRPGDRCVVRRPTAHGVTAHWGRINYVSHDGRSLSFQDEAGQYRGWREGDEIEPDGPISDAALRAHRPDAGMLAALDSIPFPGGRR